MDADGNFIISHGVWELKVRRLLLSFLWFSGAHLPIAALKRHNAVHKFHSIKIDEDSIKSCIR
ncbi:hypothetical protein M441DRAFT_54086 [Trichoderma asperellum CBS 433.97]|uniref:Uncharacterized protein n=1 Tax=Trichoderma asperellum (strain ATCC 204424 / CBS 433.97 / NBRC 101777) TaxID=1042311 RepID=A0A2T3ZJM2_TRIA4|nr:hypothetical protein M441DRAFT_54086 [Trichoderma asperellum CBS 433.97]PTB44996.1 hypothetical protein M441DRAFT_54086 [Trichoderma asperellum CBS 433.97]